jgi:glucose-6-phosphate dehydrogenase assembly protein OpcA
MKSKTGFAFIAASALCGLTIENVPAQDIDAFAPVVVKTVPEAGTKNVPTGEYEVKITFSKEMADQSWSWCAAWQNSDPESVDKPHYEADHKTCVMKVKLEPGKTYG